MEIELTRLKNGIDEYIEIDSNISYDSKYAGNTELIDLINTTVKGTIYKDNTENICADMKIEGIMVLPCSITLKPVNHSFSIEIDENIEKIYEEIDKNDKKYENSIDILPIIWENILMEMPMKVVSSDLSDMKTEGNGWKFITENEEMSINPELAKLKDLLK